MARRRRYDPVTQQEVEESFDPNDGLPGSDRESAAYSRTYRVDEFDQTKAREFAHQAEEERAAETVRDLRDRIEMLQQSSSGRVQFWPNVGRFIIPEENARDSFAAHLQLVKAEGDLSLAFNPQGYPYFDRIIAETCERPEIFDPEHPDYPKFENLRNNLAVLRNDIMGMYMDDGSFDPGDEKFVPLLQGIALEIGTQLKGSQSGWSRMFGSRLDDEILNLEGDGAVYLYDKLRERQRGHGFFSDIVSDIFRLTGIPTRQWDLPPASETPFSEAGLRAPAPEDVLCLTKEQVNERCRACEAAMHKDTHWQEYITERRNQPAPEVAHYGMAG